MNIPGSSYADAQAEWAAGGARWFLLQTHLRQEKLSIENLVRQGFEAYCPMHHQEVRPRGQPARILALPYFPRYVFARVDLGAAAWRGIYATRGVCGVLPSSDVGSKVLARLVGDLKAREEHGLLKLDPELMPCRWQPGARVAYAGYLEAIFQERVDGRRCRILVSGLLGRDSEQIVDLADLESR